jgi:hypothetical protein
MRVGAALEATQTCSPRSNANGLMKRELIISSKSNRCGRMPQRSEQYQMPEIISCAEMLAGASHRTTRTAVDAGTRLALRLPG